MRQQPPDHCQKSSLPSAPSTIYPTNRPGTDKDRWINTERERWAKYFSVPMGRMPEGFPPLTLAAQRVLCAISIKSPEKLVPVVDAFYRSMWVDGNGKIGSPEGFGPILEGVLGKNAAQEIMAEVCPFVPLRRDTCADTSTVIGEPTRCQIAPEREH